MKTIYNIMCAIMVVLMGAACSDDNTSGLRLDGDCAVQAFEVNGTYKAKIDPVKRVVKVKVPVDFKDKSQMTISDFAISEGATANMKKGDVIDFTGERNLHITNGDLFLDWNVRVLNDEAKIFSFILNGAYKASINENDHTITAFLPGTVDVKKLIPTVDCGEDATISPAVGVETDFSQDKVYTVKDNTAEQKYTVHVEIITHPVMIFLGSEGAGTIDELVPEEREACKWMLANVPNSIFVSWEDMNNNNVDLSECKVIWWHWQHAPSESLSDFENGAKTTAIKNFTTLRDFYKNGGAFILSRASVNFAASLGAIKGVPDGDGRRTCANNCWGATDDGGEVLGASWDFPAHDPNSYLWQGVKGGTEKILLLDAGYQISNCVSQWGKWAFNDGDFNYWETETGCKVLAHGWDDAITMWECPAANGTFGKGGIICFGSGCYDWYSPAPFTPVYHDNMGIITMNAINHLTK